MLSASSTRPTLLTGYSVPYPLTSDMQHAHLSLMTPSADNAALTTSLSADAESEYFFPDEDYERSLYVQDEPEVTRQPSWRRKQVDLDLQLQESSDSTRSATAPTIPRSLSTNNASPTVNHCASHGQDLLITQLTAQLHEEAGLRQAAEEEAWHLERQLLASQESAQAAQAQIQTLQQARDKLVLENQMLQMSLMDAESERLAVEAQLKAALAKLADLGVEPSTASNIFASPQHHDSNQEDTLALQHQSSRLTDITSPVTPPNKTTLRSQTFSDPTDGQGADVADTPTETSKLVMDYDDVAQRLAAKSLELALLKEQMEDEAHQRQLLERVNRQLSRKLEVLAETLADCNIATNTTTLKV